MLKYALIVLVFTAVAIMPMACEQNPLPASNTTFNLTQTQYGAGVPDNLPPVGAPSSQNLMRLEPSSVEMDVDQNVNVRVVITTPAGNEIATESLQVAFADNSVVALTHIDGRTLQLKGMSVGTTSAIVSANDLSQTLIITVN